MLISFNITNGLSYSLLVLLEQWFSISPKNSCLALNTNTEEKKINPLC